MVEPSLLKYRAFISYSHTDTNWATWLHRALEFFLIGKDLAGRLTETGEIPKSLRPVFRDRDEFSVGQALSEQTLAALDSSQALMTHVKKGTVKMAERRALARYGATNALRDQSAAQGKELQRLKQYVRLIRESYRRLTYEFATQLQNLDQTVSEVLPESAATAGLTTATNEKQD